MVHDGVREADRGGVIYAARSVSLYFTLVSPPEPRPHESWLVRMEDDRDDERRNVVAVEELSRGTRWRLRCQG